MNKLTVLVLLFTYVGYSCTHPADHREDTVLPFSLSPGNVNLETYYLDKYPKPGPGGPLKKEAPPKGSPVDENVFADDENVKDSHAIFRTSRAASPQYYPYHSRHVGSHNHGHEHQDVHHQSSSTYARERHHQSDRHQHHHNQPHYNDYNHFHG